MRAAGHGSGQDRAILAIDQGTSATKAVVVDPQDGVVAVAESPVTVTYAGPDLAEIDPTALLDSVLAAGSRALADAARPIGGVALANQGETVLAWNPASGRPLSKAVVWQDRRAQSVVASLADAAEPVARRTGLVLDAYFSAPKMAWLRRHVTTDGVVTTSDTWLLNRLCGAFVTDVSTASRSLLMDVDALGWDGELLALFGLSGEQQPQIVDADSVVGHTRLFGPEVPVAGLLVDQQAALLGQGCLDAGSAKCTVGTGAFLLANTGSKAVRSSGGLSTSVAWRLRGRADYCLDGQVFAAGTAVQWLVRLGLLGRPAALDDVAAARSGGVLCVPALTGLGAPWWRPAATGTLVGLTPATGAAEIVLAALEGIAAQVAGITDAVQDDLGARLPALRVDGGLVASRRLMQAVADITQIPVEVADNPHATALGVAVAGRLALRPDLAVADAVPPRRVSRIHEPRWSPDRAATFRRRWSQAAAVTAGDSR